MNINNLCNQWYLFNDDTVYPHEWKDILLDLSEYGACPSFVVYCRTTDALSSKETPFLPGYHSKSPSFKDYDEESVRMVDEDCFCHM